MKPLKFLSLLFFFGITIMFIITYKESSIIMKDLTIISSWLLLSFFAYYSIDERKKGQSFFFFGTSLFASFGFAELANISEKTRDYFDCLFPTLIFFPLLTLDKKLS